MRSHLGCSCRGEGEISLNGARRKTSSSKHCVHSSQGRKKKAKKRNFLPGVFGIVILRTYVQCGSKAPFHYAHSLKGSKGVSSHTVHDHVRYKKGSVSDEFSFQLALHGCCHARSLPCHYLTSDSLLLTFAQSRWLVLTFTHCNRPYFYFYWLPLDRCMGLPVLFHPGLQWDVCMTHPVGCLNPS